MIAPHPWLGGSNIGATATRSRRFAIAEAQVIAVTRLFEGMTITGRKEIMNSDEREEMRRAEICLRGCLGVNSTETD